MNNEKRLIPKLRFPEFTYAWEQRKLGEVVNILDNLRIPVAASERLKGTTPYYGANGIQGYIDGFTHDGEFVLVAEDGTNDLVDYPAQYVSGKIWVNNHAHVLQGISYQLNNHFLVYRIKSMNISRYLVGGGRAKLNANIMKDIELNLPNYEEQQKIGTFFTTLDRYITIHQRKLENVKKLKAGLLQKMFPKNDQEFPEIRFPEFTYAWEQR
ncbi:restriction endonuclease subunit S, partial [Bisgaard Taxon 10/6]